MTVYWPWAFAPLNCDINLMPRPVGGVPALAGGNQWVQSEAGIWQVNYDSLAVARPAMRKLFKSLALQINGPGTPIMLPIRSSGMKPWPIKGGQPVKKFGSIPFSDGARFSDGTGFYQSVIAVSLAASASMGDAQVSLQLDNGSALEAGMGFSMPDGRYHEISIVLSEPDPGAKVYSVEILPELRADYAAGTLCEFDRPTLIAELADTDQMQLRGSNSKFATPSVQFVEYFGS